MKNKTATLLALTLAALTVAALALGGCDDEQENETATTQAETVETATEAAEGEEEEAQESEASEDPVAELDELPETLDRAVSLYEKGSKDEALDAASAAYIEHFEGVEDALGEVDHELMEDLEQRIGVKLPDLMRKNASVAEVKSAVKQIERLLPEARKALNRDSDSY